MKSLEPWKIWAATAVLVCAILGSTAARVRPQVLGVTSAQAATLTPTEQTPAVAIPHPESSADEYEAYSSYSPGRTYFGSGYSDLQTSSIVPLSSLLYGAGGPSAIQTDEYLEPVVDVTRQIFGNQNSQTDLVANSDDLVTSHTYPTFIAVGDYDENELQNDMFADVPDDHWAYAGVPDTDPAFTFATSIREPTDWYPTDLSGSGEANIIDLAIQNTLVTGAINNSGSNGAVVLLNAISSGYNPANADVIELGKQAVASAALQNLAMSGELDDAPGVELDGLDWTKNLAVRIEEETLVLAEAQTQLQAAEQQRAEAVYNANLGRVNVQFNSSRLIVPPQE